MSNKKHKGDHGKRAERHAAEVNLASLKNPASADKPRRVYLRNWVYIWKTLGVVVAVAALIIGFAAGIIVILKDGNVIDVMLTSMAEAEL